MQIDTFDLYLKLAMALRHRAYAYALLERMKNPINNKSLLARLPPGVGYTRRLLDSARESSRLHDEVSWQRLVPAIVIALSGKGPSFMGRKLHITYF